MEMRIFWLVQSNNCVDFEENAEITADMASPVRMNLIYRLSKHIGGLFNI